jgi:hypothetical protein
MLMRASFKHAVRKDRCLRDLFHFLLRGLVAGLVLYGRYTCGIYWDDADGGQDDWYYLLYGKHLPTQASEKIPQAVTLLSYEGARAGE